jgi:hypothetical protein
VGGYSQEEWTADLVFHLAVVHGLELCERTGGAVGQVRMRLRRVDVDGVERTALNLVLQVVIVVLHRVELHQWSSGAAGQLPLCVRVVDAR